MTTALVVVAKNSRNAMVKTYKYLVVLVFLCSAHALQAQVTLAIDEKINENLRMKNAQIDSTKISGYRIQIAFNSNKSDVSSSESQFKSIFPKYSDRVYTLYQQPYWKIRVGDYYREIDAMFLLDEIRNQFPNAFLVKDYINRPKID
ncbi:MAG: mRNA-degrading endonuclease RelE of RelBE toxin-antitoxin system [Bacteroidia bacterium]|jgi:mRNA-degrading endonuclease RelE of RelBE toxin-antitoxin system